MSIPVHVAAAVLRQEQRVLLCLRSATRTAYPAMLDLPGGHIGEGETPDGAIRRELQEELDIEIATDAAHLLTLFTRPTVELHVFVVDRWTGVVRNAAPEEHDELRWVSIDELGGLELADDAYPELLRSATEWVPEVP